MSREDIKGEDLVVSTVAPKVGGNRVAPDTGFRLNAAKTFERGGLAGLSATRLKEARQVLA